MKAFYSDTFVLPLPPGHRFPMEKYRMLRERCVAEGILRPEDLHIPDPAGWDKLATVHAREYLDRVRSGALTSREQRRIGFPWSPGMVERSRRSVGATLAAARTALAERAERGWGVAANLAGGTHHAHPAQGEGFCVFNDAAVAIRVLQREGRIGHAAVIDCDVHQGNGTAATFRTDPDVTTFSIHGARNYPYRKVASVLDVPLPDGADDELYLAALDTHLPGLLEAARPELVVYVSGADPFRDDRFGRLALTKEGLGGRDRYVLGLCRELGVPCVVTMAGGYARDTSDTVDIHVRTVWTAVEMRETRPAGVRLGRARSEGDGEGPRGDYGTDGIGAAGEGRSDGGEFGSGVRGPARGP